MNCIKEENRSAFFCLNSFFSSHFLLSPTLQTNPPSIKAQSESCVACGVISHPHFSPLFIRQFFFSSHFSSSFPPLLRLPVFLSRTLFVLLWLAVIVVAVVLMVHSVDNSSPWAHVNHSLPRLFHSIPSPLFILLLLHFISRRFVLMDFAVILPSMAFAFNGGACTCVIVCVTASFCPCARTRQCICTCVSLYVSFSPSPLLPPCLLLLHWSRLPPPYIIHKC